MDLYLVRHGKAESEVKDPRRPLSPQGREEIARVARAAVKKGMSATRILHSDKLRAKETAEILAGTVHPAEGVCEINGLAPEDDPVLIKNEAEIEGEPLILVGHLPHLERLLSLLVDRNGDAQTVSFLTGTVVCLRQENAKWKVQWALHPDGV